MRLVAGSQFYLMVDGVKRTLTFEGFNQKHLIFREGQPENQTRREFTAPDFLFQYNQKHILQNGSQPNFFR